MVGLSIPLKEAAQKRGQAFEELQKFPSIE